ncbi:tRNA (guanosine(37)-N1)-methyltransferase TrmD [Candidatus Berkelbacteria bacterium RBG_13_40_8]|uniref:tRNA (guanine-N(1)-)-methyltransferase n=1 Tax=Candidatus Berkelbacteria bacterium RBG_13_40_8 TaxID=1797467 RepID=A0A1F5DMM7_9BACT|nr:MAG: tRNA (guanosine(37)-N1)-methyltransferase TrmD [Candidatus Berkelbacteria bacterium RBG_13_40_8]
MNFKIITTQPQIYDSFLKTGLISRGIKKRIIRIGIYNLHDFAFDKHKSIDDTPYGGGAGMVIKADIMDKAISTLKLKTQNSKLKTILLTPQGKPFKQQDAKRLSKEKKLIIISGRFEGYDERIRDLVDEEISIGDFVLTSGDLPAMVLIDAISRQIPGFIEKSESLHTESFDNNLLEFPQYTRPENFKGKKVPKVLLSGNHQKVAEWREKQSLLRTKKRRKDLTSYLKK